MCFFVGSRLKVCSVNSLHPRKRSFGHCRSRNDSIRVRTNLQLNVGKLCIFGALRVAIEGYVRSRRIFKTTAIVNTEDDDPMEADALSLEGKGNENLARARIVVRKAKKTSRAKVTVSTLLTTHRFTKVTVDVVKVRTQSVLTVGTNGRSLKAKAREAKSSVRSEYSKYVEETGTLVSSLRPTNSFQRTRSEQLNARLKACGCAR